VQDSPPFPDIRAMTTTSMLSIISPLWRPMLLLGRPMLPMSLMLLLPVVLQVSGLLPTLSAVDGPLPGHSLMQSGLDCGGSEGSSFRFSFSSSSRCCRCRRVLDVAVAVARCFKFVRCFCFCCCCCWRISI